MTTTVAYQSLVFGLSTKSKNEKPASCGLREAGCFNPSIWMGCYPPRPPPLHVSVPVIGVGRYVTGILNLVPSRTHTSAAAANLAAPGAAMRANNLDTEVLSN